MFFAYEETEGCLTLFFLDDLLRGCIPRPWGRSDDEGGEQEIGEQVGGHLECVNRRMKSSEKSDANNTLQYTERDIAALKAEPKRKLPSTKIKLRVRKVKSQ